MNKKAYIKNVIRTTLAEAYVKQANAKKITPVSVANTEVTKPVTPLQKVFLPLATGLYGATFLSRHSKPGSPVAGAIIGGGVGAGAGLFANYIQALIRRQQIAEVQAGR